MLIIANGTFKSGSTWQRDIIKNLLPIEEIPDEYRNPQKPTFLNLKKIGVFLEADEVRRSNYIVKSHIYHPEQIELIYNKPNVFILMIERDLRDTIVSHYHHFKNQRKISIPFNWYYWTIGRYKAMQVVLYNNRWRNLSNNVLHCRFEDFKINIDTEIKRIAEFLNIPVSEKKVDEIKAATHIEKVRDASNRKWFYRKGEVGDSKNYFSHNSHKMIDDIDKIENGLGSGKSIFSLFELRVKVNRLLIK